jgi:hypothetical protein
VEERDKARERKAEREEEDTEERIEESGDKVRGGSPPPTAHPALKNENREGETHGEQHEHRGLEEGEYKIDKCETPEFRENEVHKQGEVKDKPTCSNRVHEPLEGEVNRIREYEDDTPHPALSTPAGPAVNPVVPHEHAGFDWATNDDQSIGPIPCVTDFRPTKPLSPFVSPSPAPRPPDNPTMPLQPICMPPNPTTPVPPEPEPKLVSKIHPIMPTASTLPIAHGWHNFSALRSGRENPWGSLRHCQHRSHPACNYHRDSQMDPNPPRYLHPHPPYPSHSNSQSRHSFNSQPHLEFNSWQPELLRTVFEIANTRGMATAPPVFFKLFNIRMAYPQCHTLELLPEYLHGFYRLFYILINTGPKNSKARQKKQWRKEGWVDTLSVAEVETEKPGKAKRLIGRRIIRNMTSIG